MIRITTAILIALLGSTMVNATTRSTGPSRLERRQTTPFTLATINDESLPDSYTATISGTGEAPHGWGSPLTFKKGTKGYNIAWTDGDADACIGWNSSDGNVFAKTCTDADAGEIEFTIACDAATATPDSKYCAFYHGAITDKRCIGVGTGVDGGSVQLPADQCDPDNPASWAIYDLVKAT